MKSHKKSSNKKSTVIIFDWDDTICPSTFVEQMKVNHFNDLPQHYQNLMNEIGRTAEKCLAAAAKHGQVILITNSDEGWVHYSCEKYIPNLLPHLDKYRIVSARTEYESFYPGAPLCWKAAAFAHEVNETFFQLEEMRENANRMHTNDWMDVDAMNMQMSPTASPRNVSSFSSSSPRSPSAFEALNSTDDSSDDSRDERKSRFVKGQRKRSSSNAPSSNREVISFGDSMEERTAVKIVSKQLEAVPKSVLFISSPNLEQLIGQLTMLEMHMKYICTHASAMDLEISPQQAEKSALNYLRARQAQRNARARQNSSPTSSPRPHRRSQEHAHHSHHHNMHMAHGSGHSPHAGTGHLPKSFPHQPYYPTAPASNVVPRMRRATGRGYDDMFSV